MPPGFHRYAASAALIVALLSPGASAESWKPVVSLLEQRHTRVVVQEWDLSCGAAALATLLTYQHGDPIPEKDIASTMLANLDPEEVRTQLGFSLLDLKEFVDARGYEGIGYGNVDFEDLNEMAPAIVPVRLRTFDHFVVFRGLAGDDVLLADPAYGTRTLPRRQFEEVWQKNVAFVVKKKGAPSFPNQLALHPDDLVAPSNAMIRSALR